MNDNKYSVRRGLKLILKGNIETALAIRSHANHIVTNFPWLCVGAVIFVSLVCSIGFGMQCKYRQTTAEQQRDSLYILIENYKTAHNE